ncbi:aspartic peptidase domain-containing protein [Suillus spraguei]|nr:aspartic peptidase domain-containing protein [Suillus spraguei]
MFITASLLILLLASSITGSPVEVRNPPIIIPLTRRLNFSNGTVDLVQHDRARVAAFRDYNTHGRRAESIPMSFKGLDEYYSVALDVGSPPTTYDLVVDTGSAVTWIGARTPYHETGVNTGRHVEVAYGDGKGSDTSFSGTFFVNTVTLGGLTISNYELAVASTSKNLKLHDGVLGIGPRDLTVGTLTNDPPATYLTFTDWLVTAGAIGRNIVGIFFRPLTGDGDTNVGELVFGEPDYTKCTSNIVYTQATLAPRSIQTLSNHVVSVYWGIDQRITYGNTDINILLRTAGIIDTGNDFIYIASGVYLQCLWAATGATFDEQTGLLRITLRQYSALQDLKFHIGNVWSLQSRPQRPIWPYSHNHIIPGAEKDGIYFIIKSLTTRTGAGLDFIVGYTFMQRFYTVLDRDNREVGFATTSFTYAITN